MQSSDPKHDDDLDAFIWGARSIGALIGRSERATFRLLEQGALPATKFGRQWATTKRRILDAMVTPRVEAAE
jgi:hypothetical protein